MIKRRCLSVFIGFLLVTTACSSHKKTIVPTHPVPFEWLTAKVTIDAEGNGKKYDNLSGQIRMRRDSLLWLSVTATMGVEVMRAKVSTDSVWIVNRMDKTHLVESIDTLGATFGLPLSLQLVQTLLLDNNESLSPVENQTVMLSGYPWGRWSAKLRYNNIQTDVPTTFPLKITNKMERMSIKKSDRE